MSSIKLIYFIALLTNWYNTQVQMLIVPKLFKYCYLQTVNDVWDQISLINVQFA